MARVGFVGSHRPRWPTLRSRRSSESERRAGGRERTPSRPSLSARLRIQCAEPGWAWHSSSAPQEPRRPLPAGPGRAHLSSNPIRLGAGFGLGMTSPGAWGRTRPEEPSPPCAAELTPRSQRRGAPAGLADKAGGRGVLVSEHPGPELSRRPRPRAPFPIQEVAPCPGKQPPPCPPCKSRAGRARGAAPGPRAHFAHPLSGPRPCLQRPCVCRTDCIEL